jgi:hypothetical protein
MTSIAHLQRIHNIGALGELKTPTSNGFIININDIPLHEDFSHISSPPPRYIEQPCLQQYLAPTVYST